MIWASEIDYFIVKQIKLGLLEYTYVEKPVEALLHQTSTRDRILQFHLSAP